MTVREALRVLEASGIVQIRVGARGGAFVTTPSSDRLGEGLADLISLSPVTAADTTEARMVLELGILPLVIERATDKDIDELDELVRSGERALKDGTYTMSDSAAFHVRVAACTHNPAIEMILHSFHGPLLMSLQEAQTAEPLMGRRGVREHREYVECHPSTRRRGGAGGHDRPPQAHRLPGEGSLLTRRPPTAAAERGHPRTRTPAPSDSGLGVEGSLEELQSYTRSKSVVLCFGPGA